MFGLGDSWDKSPSCFLAILKLPSFYSSIFKIFKNTLGQFIPNRLPKHVITSTNYFIIPIFEISEMSELSVNVKTANTLKYKYY